MGVEMTAPSPALRRIQAGSSAETVAVATVILDLCRVLLGGEGSPLGKSDKGLMSLEVHGFKHTPGCPHSQWLSPNSPRPHGDPCSDRCEQARAAIRAAGAWLKAHEVEAPAAMRQPTLFEEAV